MFIDQMTRADMVKFMRFMGFNKEAGARVFKIKDGELAYEPDQTLLVVAFQVSKRPYMFVFSDHGLVNICPDAKPEKALVEINSEFELFERTPSVINITKQFLGYMTSRFKHEYLDSEIKRRTHILRSLTFNSKRATKEKTQIAKEYSTLAQILGPMKQNPEHANEYFDIDLMYLKNQFVEESQDRFIEELNNQINYQTHILSYLEDNLKTILMETYLQVKQAYPNSTLLSSLQNLGEENNTPPESFGA